MYSTISKISPMAHFSPHSANPTTTLLQLAFTTHMHTVTQGVVALSYKMKAHKTHSLECTFL